VDLTSQIPKELRLLLVKNLLSLPVLDTGLKHQFELSDEDIQEVNSVFSTLGDAISHLVNLPEWLLQEVKFSEIITREVSNIYNNRLPEVLKRAIASTTVDHTLVWNSLVAIHTGTIKFITSYVLN